MSHIGKGGAFKRMVQGASGAGTAIGVGGSWKSVQGMWVGQGGAWKKFFPGAVLSAGDGGLVNQTDPSSPFDTTVGIRFLPTGVVQVGKRINGQPITWTDHGVWITPPSEASSRFDVRCTGIIGSWTTQAAAPGTFVDLGTTRTWLLNRTTSGSISLPCDFEVQDGDGALPTANVGYVFSITNGI